MGDRVGEMPAQDVRETQLGGRAGVRGRPQAVFERWDLLHAADPPSN